MHRLGLVILASLTLAALAAHARAEDGAIVARSPYRWIAWDSLRTPERFVARGDWERARADTEHVFERVEYLSGDRVVPAYVFHGRRPMKTPAPAVVYVRGSWIVGDIGWQLAPMFRRLDDAGFVVIAPLLRGSDGAPGPDEMGGADVEDLLAVPRLAAALGIVDTTRLFLYGESRGGMMVFQAIRDGAPARDSP
jgi:dipeptidyl aminopeptidase/acylaminoacyl peptidase